MTPRIIDRPLKTPGAKPMPYDQAVADAICDRLTEGRTLSKIATDDDMPSAATIYRWLGATPTFREQYARAREHQMNAWSDEVLDISDDGSGDLITRARADGSDEEVVDHENIARSRLRVDTRKFLMARLAPKVYGDKVEIDLNASVKIENRTDAELEALARSHLERLGIEAPAGPLLLGHVPLGAAPSSPLAAGGADPGNDDGGPGLEADDADTE
jgi:hypothetical protein